VRSTIAPQPLRLSSARPTPHLTINFTRSTRSAPRADFTLLFPHPNTPTRIRIRITERHFGPKCKELRVRLIASGAKLAPA
jgi:hypothetical protein